MVLGFSGGKAVSIEIYSAGIATDVCCDLDAITRVLDNLLSNAIKKAPAGSTISICFDEMVLPDTVPGAGHEAVPAVLVLVRDQGAGIPEDETEIIFFPYIQSRNEIAGSGGTGLGLAICKQIVKSHSGSIWAENNPDGGASFCFVIPVKQTV
jgi:signal transduction histidine kinase